MVLGTWKGRTIGRIGQDQLLVARHTNLRHQVPRLLLLNGLALVPALIT